MMRFGHRALAVWVRLTLGAAAAQAQPAEMPQQLRSVTLGPDPTAAPPVVVVGAPHLKTRILLDQPFAAGQVVCGVSCAAVGDGAAAEVHWLMEVRPEERSVLLWPARLPDAAHPPTSFTTHVQILTESRALVPLTLRLVRLAGPHEAQEPADALVALKLPAEGRSSGPAAAPEALPQLLRGRVACHSPRLPRPHRRNHLVVTVEQLCRSRGTPSLAWVLLTLDNRGAQPVALAALQLEPHPADLGEPSPPTQWAAARTLRPGEAQAAVAVVALPDSREADGRWSLSVVPDAEPALAVVVGPLAFPP